MLQNHIDYIHYNPVKHGHVNNPSDWPHSTIHHYIKTGRLESIWDQNIDPMGINTGEPE